MGEVEGPVRLYGVLAVFQPKLGDAGGVSHQTVCTGNYLSHVFGLAHLVDDFSLKEIPTWGQSKIMELAIRVSVGTFAGGENIDPLILRVVDLLLRNCGGRNRRPN